MNLIDNKSDSNIIISSWPSAGGSTQARLIALIFNMNYVYAGGVLKYWVDAMGYDSKTNEINKWGEKYHEHWDYVWENYLIEKIKYSKNTLFEGKTAGFLTKEPNIFKIFIKASLEARTKRSKGDKRAEEIKQRDEFLRQEWFSRFGFDLFDEESIKEKYSLIIDSSDISIQDTFMLILEALKENKIREFNYAEKVDRLKQIMKQYNTDSKYLINEIEHLALIQTPQKCFEEIKLKHMHLIANIPEEMKVVFN